MFIVIIKMTDYQKFLYKKYLMLLDEYFGASGKNNSIKVRFFFFLFNGGEVIAEVLTDSRLRHDRRIRHCVAYSAIRLLSCYQISMQIN